MIIMIIGVVSYFNPAECKDYLQTTKNIPQINKAASSVNAIVLGLLKEGHKVIVITSYDEEGPTLHLYGELLNVHIVSTFSRRPKAELFKRWYMVKRIRKELEKHIDAMDVIHTHWTYDFALASATFAKNKPVFCTIRDWSPIINKYENGIKAKIRWWLISGTLFRKVTANKHVHFIANSQYIHKLLTTAHPTYHCDMIENPIKTEFVKCQREDYPDTPVFVSIAQSLMEQRKNYETLLKAFQEVRKQKPQARMLLIGFYAPHSPMGQRWAEKGLTENVEMLGFMDHDTIIEVLDHSSALVHPSLEESFGNTLLEGMARRIPVIGGKESGAVPYVLGQGKYGILCNVKDADDLARAMLKALDITQMMETIECATKYLQSTLTNDIIVKRHIELFTSVLRNSHE